MKKSIPFLIFLEILLSIVIIGYNHFGIGQPKNIEYVIQNELKNNEIPSLNYILKYEMPDNYLEAFFQTEIGIMNSENTSVFTADVIMEEDTTKEQFLNQYSDLFNEEHLKYSIIDEVSLDLEDKTINKKIYQVSDDFQTMFSFGATIQFKDKPNEFIGILGNSSDIEAKKDFELLLDTINYTTQTLDKEKLFSSDLENISVTMPANWKKVKNQIPYNFYKQNDNNMIFAMISSGDKTHSDINSEYDLAKESFLQDGFSTLIEDSKIDNLDNKTIKTSVIKSPATNSTIFLILIEFNNSNIFTAVRYEITGEDNSKNSEKDLESIIKSIKLK